MVMAMPMICAEEVLVVAGELYLKKKKGFRIIGAFGAG